jgi:hypothetical protein
MIDPAKLDQSLRSTDWRDIENRRCQIAGAFFRFDRIEAGLHSLDLTRFLDADRFPLRWKTL